MFFPNVPGATLIPGATSIPESRVGKFFEQHGLGIDKIC